MRFYNLSFVLLIILLSIISCSRKTIIRKYYVLESRIAIDDSSFDVQKKYPFKVDIRDFRVAKAFDQTRIAVRSESHELNYYFYHQLVNNDEKVGDAFFDAHLQYVNNHKLQRGVRVFNLFGDPSLIIGGYPE